MNNGRPHRFDHLVLGVGALAAGIAELAARTGVEAIGGGEHPHLGTHNALASLGEHAYLEIVAPRPDADPDTSRFSRLATGMTHLTPILWAVATTDAEATRERLAAAGFTTTEPVAGSRRRPDGVTIEWRIFDVDGPAPAPFFIEWGTTTPHPAATSPPGCSLVDFELASDAPQTMDRLLAALQLDRPVRVVPAATPALRATLSSAAGRFELGSSG